MQNILAIRNLGKMEILETWEKRKAVATALDWKWYWRPLNYMRSKCDRARTGTWERAFLWKNPYDVGLKQLSVEEVAIRIRVRPPAAPGVLRRVSAVTIRCLIRWRRGTCIDKTIVIISQSWKTLCYRLREKWIPNTKQMPVGWYSGSSTCIARTSWVLHTSDTLSFPASRSRSFRADRFTIYMI